VQGVKSPLLLSHRYVSVAFELDIIMALLLQRKSFVFEQNSEFLIVVVLYAPLITNPLVFFLEVIFSNIAFVDCEFIIAVS
jgi:hypothetical protein